MPILENGHAIVVQIDIGLNTADGQLIATFQSLDPKTNLPPDVLTGFLPPEDGTGRGMGYFSYIVQAKPGLLTGTQIRNIAIVTFDTNPPIATDQKSDEDPTQGIDPTKQDLITIDSSAPASTVAPLPSDSGKNFTVSWSANDDSGGSGIAGYDVLVSDNGGPFSLWQSATTTTSATYNGSAGHTYAFYSVATDNVGNIEPVPTAAQATTLVATNLVTSTVAPLPAFSPASFPVSWLGSDYPGGSGIATYSVYVSDNGGAFAPFLTDTATTSATFNGLSGHTYDFYSVAKDQAGNAQPTPSTAQATTRVDATAPGSKVSALPASSPASFTVSWSGKDDTGGSGIGSYTVYVSDNGGAFAVWQKNVTATSATYNGAAGHTYGFYSLATDKLGNAEHGQPPPRQRPQS